MSDDQEQDDLDPTAEPIVAEGLRRFKICAEAESAQRKSVLLAKKFRALDQWDPDVREQREGASALQGVAAQPKRPCLTIDRISQPVRQVSNSIKNANITATVTPNGGGATKEHAEILKDWMRRVQNDARAEAPIEWAADGAAEGGIGWFRLRTDYVQDAVDEAVFDQDAKLERVTNNLTIYCDPSSLHPTRRTARFMFAVDDVPRSEYKRRWPDAKLSHMDEFTSEGDGAGWTTEETIRIAEYWHVDYTPELVVQLVDGQILKAADAKQADKKMVKHSRTIQTPKFICTTMDCLQPLDEKEWMGSRIPLFPILGEELNVDGKVVLRGVIQPAMDAQRMVNYTYSAAIETAALEPKSPWVATAAAIGNYKAMWQTANTTNYSALFWDEFDSDNPNIHNSAPFRTPAGANIGAFVEMMSRSEEAVKATTSIFDPSLGKNTSDQSGKAIQALQAQAEHANSNFLTNTQMTVLDLATEMVFIAPKILDRPGRVLSVLGIDDNARHVMLGQPHQEGPDGQPQALMGANGQPLTPDEMQTLQGGMAKFFDLSKGKYGVTVTTGKSYLTRRQEGSDAMGQLIPHLPPQMAAAVTPAFIQSLDFPESEKIADMARKTLPPELQETEGEQAIPPQAQAQIAAMQQQMQQMGQALQEAQSGIPVKQLEIQGQMQKTQMELQQKDAIEREKIASNERIAALDNQTKLLIAGQQLDVQRAKVIAEVDRTLADQSRAGAEQAHAHGHEIGMVKLAHAQDIARMQETAAQSEMAAQAGHERAQELMPTEPASE